MQKNWKSIFVISFVEFIGRDTFEFLSLVWLLNLYSSSPHYSRRGYLWHKESEELSMSLGDWMLCCCSLMQTQQGSEATPEKCSWSPWDEHLNSLLKRQAFFSQTPESKTISNMTFCVTKLQDSTSDGISLSSCSNLQNYSMSRNYFNYQRNSTWRLSQN